MDSLDSLKIFLSKSFSNHYWKLLDNISVLIQKKQELKAAVDNIVRHRIISKQLSDLRKKVAILDREVMDVQKIISAPPNLKVVKRHAKRVLQLNSKACILLQQAKELTNELVVPELFFGMETVKKNMNAIMESLKDPLIHKIGIYGMAGSGKTETLMSITSCLSTTNEFDKIIYVSVTENFDLAKLQMKIAQQLQWDLKLPKDKNIMFERTKANKFLIIFDDIWGPISLDELGIPDPNGTNNCKIVLVSRSLNVCHAMKTDKNIKMNLLSKEDAWELFLSRAGDEILSLDIAPLAEQIVDECDGLPLAIIEIGNFMSRRVDMSVCKQMLECLRGSQPRPIGSMEFVLFSLKQSYLHLHPDELQKFFLLSAILPKDYRIEGDELVRYWIAEGFIQERSMDRGYSILRELIDAGLIAECSNLETDHIKMHSLTRCFATQQLEKWGDALLNEAGLGLSESPSIYNWEQARKISLENNKIEVLPNQPNCPNICVLILRENPLSHSISSSFFSRMPALRFLDLSRTGISELPSSLSELLNLEALYLQECAFLERIPSLANMKRLRELYLSHTSIREPPQGMEELIRLRTLDLSFTHQLGNLTIPILPSLEEFFVEGSKFLCVDAPTVANTIRKIRCLNRLLKLSLSFVRLDDYQAALMSLEWGILKSFSITISHTMDLFNIHRNKYIQNSVYICNQNVCNHSSTLLLPSSTQELKVTLCDIPRLSDLLCLRNMQSLRKCHIERCSLISSGCLILGEEMEEHTLTNLENLSLENVRGLTVLWTGPMHHPCFTNLRVLEVQWCGGLKTLFSINLLNFLKKIEIIQVRECIQLEEIVQGPYEEANGDHISTITTSTTVNLPCLHTLILQGLPELHTISKIIWVCDLLRWIEIVKCPRLKKLPFSVESLPRLKTIKGEKDWWGALEWDDNKTKSLLQVRFQHTKQMY